MDISGIMMRLPATLLLLTLTACAPFPEIDALGPESAAPPQLLPIDDLLAQAGTPTADPGPALAGRAARLKARAAALSASSAAP